MHLRLALQNADQPRAISTDQVEQVGRKLGDAEQDGPGRGLLQQRTELGRLRRLKLSEPAVEDFFRSVRRGNMRPVHKPRGQCAYCHSKTVMKLGKRAVAGMIRATLRGSAHATFCGTSAVG